MKIIRYRITLEEPALFTTLAGDPNSLVSLDYIPGSSVRGMVIGAILRQQGKDFALDAGHREDRSLFFSGETRYLNAYPLINERRSLPIPQSWKTFKYLSEDDDQAETIDVYDVDYINHSARKNDVGRIAIPEGRKTKTLNGFVQPNDATGSIYEPKRAINVHTQRNRNTRHNRNNSNAVSQAVFRYDALASNQTFEGFILCDRDDNANTIAAALDSLQYTSIGGARSAGYGRVSIHNVDFVDNLDTWQEAPLMDGEALLLTLLSDVIVRDTNGVYSPTPHNLEALLESDGIACQLKPVSMSTHLVGGFNRKWGLPLPQVPVISMGSVFEIRFTDGTVDQNALLTAIYQGIGERTLDGFGRFTIGWQQHDQLTMTEWSTGINTPEERVELSDLGQMIWSGTTDTQIGLAERLRLQAIDNQLTGVVYTSNYTIRGKVTLTQLSRLRSLIANTLRQPEPSRTVLVDYLEDIKDKRAGRLLDESYIGTQSLSSWLSNPDFGDDVPRGIQKRDKYLLRMVDAALERAHKEKSVEREA